MFLWNDSFGNFTIIIYINFLEVTMKTILLPLLILVWLLSGCVSIPISEERKRELKDEVERLREDRKEPNIINPRDFKKR